jgi:hypothetical protein
VTVTTVPVEAEPERGEDLDEAVVQVAGDPSALFHHPALGRLLEDVERHEAAGPGRDGSRRL